jgi:para-aminobenzoate synthetase component II
VILIVDNYDSFVHNIARYFEELGAPTRVVRNDAVTDVDAGALVISPGPCTPKEAGQSNALIRQYAGKLPILGICLGHQCVGEVFGGKVARAKRPMHGEASDIHHDGQGLFQGIPDNFSAGRYHSLIVERGGDELQVTATSAEGEIMALKHRDHPTFGVQFHPESILTEYGYAILRNFLGYIP